MDKNKESILIEEQEAYLKGWNDAKQDESICRTNDFYYDSEQNLEKKYLDGVILYYTREKYKIK